MSIRIRQGGYDVAEQDPFSDENVEEVNGFIREDVLVQAKVECVEQRERVYVHGCPQLSEGGRKRGRRRKRGEQEVDDDPGGIGAYDGHGFAPSLKQRHDARHGPLVRADAAAHKADSHTAVMNTRNTIFRLLKLSRSRTLMPGR